ncbi:MAG: tRNA uracil 4-sulfurtransferase ThiI [bacterium]
MHRKQKKCLVIHYGEIALKGNNRRFFENKLIKNIKRALQGLAFDEVERLQGRFLVHLPEEAAETMLTSRLKYVFGISHFSLGLAVPREMRFIKEAAWALLQDLPFDSFKINTKRAEKDFPLNSVEINREVGAFVQERCGKRVDLSHPQATCFIEIAGPYALLYTEKVPGLRGLPVGVSERAVSLLSSGIDSPVASYLMLKRGVQVVYTHFHSQPFTSKASEENVQRLVEILSKYQFRARVYFIPFIDLQKEIMARCPQRLRVLLYRRYMVRLAERIAEAENATALVTGENVGQVASQTLSNLRVVGEVTGLPILRPLAGYDKEEIIQLAKQIGTYQTSIEPYEDCCSLFVPANPETRANPEDLAKAERLLNNVESLMAEALASAKLQTVEVDYACP